MAVWALAAWPAAAQNELPPREPPTVGALLAQCDTDLREVRARCSTFLLKTIQENRDDPDPAFCLRPDTILGDVRARFIVWASVNVAYHESPAAAGVETALAEAFPCPLTQSG